MIKGSIIAFLISTLGVAAAHAAPADGNAHYRIATRLLHGRDYAGAIAEYQRAMALGGDPATLYDLAEAHRLAGHPDHAIMYYKMFARVHPRSPLRFTVKARIATLAAGVRRAALAAQSARKQTATATEPTPAGAEDAVEKTDPAAEKAEPVASNAGPVANKAETAPVANKAEPAEPKADPADEMPEPAFDRLPAVGAAVDAPPREDTRVASIRPELTRVAPRHEETAPPPTVPPAAIIEPAIGADEPVATRGYDAHERYGAAAVIVGSALIGVAAGLAVFAHVNNRSLEDGVAPNPIEVHAAHQYAAAAAGVGVLGGVAILAGAELFRRHSLHLEAQRMARPVLRARGAGLEF